MTKAADRKVLVLGIDGMDPRLSKKYLRKGVMPNLQKLIDRGSCREDLTLLGAYPTITPPMWTTLATGAYANTHGITGFYRRAEGKPLDTIEYNMDSTKCLAEQMWNVSAEAGKKIDSKDRSEAFYGFFFLSLFSGSPHERNEYYFNRAAGEGSITPADVDYLCHACPYVFSGALREYALGNFGDIDNDQAAAKCNYLVDRIIEPCRIDEHKPRIEGAL